MSRLFSLLLVLSIQSALAKYRSCHGSVKYTEASVVGCGDGSMRCTLTRGETASLSITFTPNEDHKQVDVKVTGKLGPLPFPFPYPESDGCRNSGLKCPLTAGQQAVYNTSLEISPSFPTVPEVAVRFQLLDKEPIVCFEFDAALK